MAGKRYTQDEARAIYEKGKADVMASWRHWYDNLPESLRSQIDAYEVSRREEVAA